ncbi:MAG: SAM-dependent methyltransferase [Betaproteobacteria bacterium RIFCSPLOWO2_12_FULL_65_14]|nr:MAG: SAM-dependent methyltransferase [Betaproteobacteria bacterium RIFCSPLOWO2_12_FULL_65_14]
MLQNTELARWNERFSAPDYIFGTAPNAFLASKAALFKPGQRALCVADGEGRNSVWLAGQGLEVTAFDISPIGVAKAQRLAAQRGVRVVHEVASVYDWSWPQAQFDVVAAIFVQFADPAMRSFLFEHMKRSLKPGGLVLIEGYTPKQLEYNTGGPSKLENLYTAELLRSSFAGFEVLELREYEAELEEGSRHAGTSALIDFVARNGR